MSANIIKSAAEEGPEDNVFGEIISVYSKEQAIEDGVLQDYGRLLNRNIVLTSNFTSSLEKEEVIFALVNGLNEALKFNGLQTKKMSVNGKEFFLNDNGLDLTFMLPEDY
jgi:hypothetical protein